MKNLLCLFFFGLGLVNSSTAQTIMENLTKEISEIHKNSGIPGFAVAIVNEDSILYKGSFGIKNVKTKDSFSTNQRFYIASISKTFIGLAIMKLIEEGQLELFTPINSILPFQVTNPYFPDEEITIEHLARHTSSILDGNIESKSWYLENRFELKKQEIGKTAFKDFCNWKENEKTELGTFLKSCLSPNGKFYSKGRFSEGKPGDVYKYSNIGAALAAYIVEIETGISYDEYIENLINKEFGFESGIWRNRSTDELPISYFQTKVEVPIHTPILYPTGGMMLSCDELTIYLIEMIKGFSKNSNTLNSESFQQMMTSQKTSSNPQSGIFWELKDNEIGHNGGNYGTTCFMSFNKKTRIGKIFITNISSYKNDDLIKEMLSVWRKLKEYESQLN